MKKKKEEQEPQDWKYLFRVTFVRKFVSFLSDFSNQQYSGVTPGKVQGTCPVSCIRIGHFPDKLTVLKSNSFAGIKAKMNGKMMQKRC